MSRTLLLCFIHGFKGGDDTFKSFPADLQEQVSRRLPDHNVESIVYPKYETKGELGQCCTLFLSWLKEKVINVRKVHSESPWPPHDRDVGVILVAHSMGGFVASDTLFLILNEKKEGSLLFPLVQGILTFDTPFNGLARSMFVYGAFSNYQKVSTVFNVMTALSAAPSALGRSAMKQTTARLPSAKPSRSAWQLIAVRTGTVGAIAAGGVAAYKNREKIMRNLNKESVKEGYRQGMDALSQGLAYINRGNVGQSFEYLSDHFTFVGTLMKQQELSLRLERLGALKGVGIRDFYTSLGENGMWSGGYFVPERTFCAIPAKDHQSYPLFSRKVISKAEEEMQAHMSMFIKDKNEEYEQMMEEASILAVRWFNDDSAVFDDLKFALPPSPNLAEQPVATTEDGQEIPKVDYITNDTSKSREDSGEEDQDSVPDASPLDITAAASIVPLPDGEILPENEAEKEQKRTYMRYLMQVAQQAGTGVKSYVPTKIPEMPQIPSGSSFRSYLPTQMPQMPSIPRPSVSMFSKAQQHVTPSTDKPIGDDSDPDKAIEPHIERKRADSGVQLPSEPEETDSFPQDPTAASST
ncbi:hypothetical protein F5Y11DRAFT_363771 [Daldinia sp. FL1419]|nr:hypothetical protein F5Y11DRAFT_363771 [Daldinia sp. FL1419]